MTATDISALYILCCLLMTGVTAKVILMACKPVLWSEIKMIKVPVSKSNDYDDEFIYDVDLFDSDGDYICLSANESVADELIIIINNHYDLVKSLKDMTEVVGGNFCQNMEIKRKYKEARELLEKCK